MLFNIMRFASFLFLSALFPLFLTLFLTGYISIKDIKVVCEYVFKISSYYHRILSQILRFISRKTKFVFRFLYSKLLLVCRKVYEILSIKCDEIEERKDNRLRMKSIVEIDTKIKIGMNLYNVVNNNDVANDENNSTYALEEHSRANYMEEMECSLAGLTINDVRMQSILSCVHVCVYSCVCEDLYVCVLQCVCVRVHMCVCCSVCVCVCERESVYVCLYSVIKFKCVRTYC